MYNYSGLYFLVKSNIVFWGILALLSFVFSRFWNKEKRNKKEFIWGLFLGIVGAFFVSYYVFAIKNMEIAVHEGMFIAQHRDSPHILRNEYIFTNDNGLKPRFFLDIFSQEEICPEKFEKNVMYRIYYEDRTDVIVKVERLEHGLQFTAPGGRYSVLERPYSDENGYPFLVDTPAISGY